MYLYMEREERDLAERKTTITPKLEFWNIYKVAKLEATLVNVYRATKS